MRSWEKDFAGGNDAVNAWITLKNLGLKFVAKHIYSASRQGSMR
jgi:hypothetical protein